MNEYLIEQFKKLEQDGKTTISLAEASQLSGSAFQKGGRFGYTPTTYQNRYANPLRLMANQETLAEASARWVIKSGDATSSNSPTGPWGETVSIDSGNTDAVFWSLPMRTVASTIPVRRWFWSDLPQFSEAIMTDIELELSTREAESCATNNDANTLGTPVVATASTAVTTYGNGYQWTITIPSTTGISVGSWVQVTGATPSTLNGFFRVLSFVANTSVTIFYPFNPGSYTAGTVSVTPAGTAGVGGQSGLRGLDSYNDSLVTFSTGTTISNIPGFVFGASGDSMGADNYGRHSVSTVQQGGASPSATLVYADLQNMMQSLPGQYWNVLGTYWSATPAKINEMRTLKDTNGLPLLIDTGIMPDEGSTISLMGIPIIPNPYLSAKYPLYLMNHPSALSFIDHGDVELSLYEQSLPGSITILAQKRVCFSIRKPNSVVRLKV